MRFMFQKNKGKLRKRETNYKQLEKRWLKKSSLIKIKQNFFNHNQMNLNKRKLIMGYKITCFRCLRVVITKQPKINLVVSLKGMNKTQTQFNNNIKKTVTIKVLITSMT